MSEPFAPCCMFVLSYQATSDNLDRLRKNVLSQKQSNWSHEFSVTITVDQGSAWREKKKSDDMGEFSPLLGARPARRDPGVHAPQAGGTVYDW